MKTKFYLFAALCCAFITLLPQKALADSYSPKYRYDGVLYVYNFTQKRGEVVYEQLGGILNYKDLSGDVTIASYVPGIGEITAIAKSAFSYKKEGNMISVTLPGTIQKIEQAAFYDTPKLYSIHLNEGLKEMGRSVFYRCTALTEVYIPTTLKEIPENTFYKCTSLPAIALSAGIEHIGSEAFFGCTALQTVKSQSGGNNVKTIGAYAFYNCSSLYDVRFSNGLTSIGTYAFYGCTKLENLSLPAKLASIGDFAFLNSGLKILTVDMTTPININANVFTGVDLSQCTLYVPKGCKDAYKNADVWKKFGHILEIGETLTPDPEEETVEPVATGKQKIGDLWYDLHEDLTAKLLMHDDNKALTGAIKVPATVTFGKYTYTVNEMEEQVFSECSSITSVTVPNTISEITYQAFKNCTGLTNVILPSALTSIGWKAFNNCSALTFVSLPASLTEISAYAFMGCKALTSVYIPAGIKTIKEYCFSDCDKLATVSLPEGLTEIELAAFFNCPALTTITLPASLTKLGDDLFNGEDMVSIRSLRETPPTATAKTFRSMNTATCILYVPNGTKSLYEYATGWGTFYNIQEKGVTETIKYGKLFYKLREDFTAMVTYETNGADNYKDLSGEITVEDKVIYQGAEYTVTNVGPSAFIKCKTISKVNLPTSINEINSKAFEECTALEDVNIPYTVTYLAADAFDKSKLFIDNTDEDGAVYYDGCLLALTKQLPAAEYKVKEGTGMIATWVFENQDDLTAITLPDGLQVLCSSAISHMVNLKTLTLPASINFIGGGFCNDCFSLTSIYNYSESPYDLSDVYCFDNINTAKCTLYVPKGSRTAYQSAAEWKNFPIYEMKGVYTVTFEDWNGFELKSEKVTEGEAATAPADPEREGYHFTGWDKKFDNVQSDLTVTATYAINSYTVTFRDMNPSVILKTESVNYGAGATAPEAPEHTGYHFLYWTPEYDVITADLDVYAQYEMNTYTVRFEDWDGTELNTFMVDHAHMINLIDMPDESALTRDCYTFKGWKSSADETLTEEQIAAEEVMKDETYTAYYEINTYQLTFVCEHGTINLIEDAVDPDAVECGSKLHFSVTPDEGYVFDKWDFEYDELEGCEITDNTTITALMKILTYTVTFVDWDEKVLKTQTVDWNTAATAPEEPEREGYTFTGWDPADFSHVTSDLTVTAAYTINTYTVTFVDWDEKVLKTQTVDWNTAATAPEEPEREGYTFTGWDPADFSHVTSDLTVTAQYKENPGTGVDEIVNRKSSNRKLIIDGVLYIERNGRRYDAAGRIVD